MLVTLKEILKDSVEKGYAVGAFDTTEHPFAEYIIEAAENQNKPVIMMVPGFAFGSRYDEEFYTYLVQRIKEAKVPICLHLDHGASFEHHPETQKPIPENTVDRSKNKQYCKTDH